MIPDDLKPADADREAAEKWADARLFATLYRGEWLYDDVTDAYLAGGREMRDRVAELEESLAETGHLADALTGRCARLEADRDRMKAVLIGYEKWEADLVLNNDWGSADGLPVLTHAEYDGLMKLQAERNAALGR